MKSILLFCAALVLSSSAIADELCGQIEVSDSDYYINTAGGGTVQLFPHDSFLSKPTRDLKAAIGKNVCVAGDENDEYSFIVSKVFLR